MSSIRIGEDTVEAIHHSGVDVTPVTTESRGQSLLQFSVDVRKARQERSAGSGSRRRTLRRLRGFVVEDHGREFKVAFVPDDTGAKEKPILYYLPADLLRHAGVTAENQQFELDEVITKFRDGSVAVTYHVRQSAPANEGFVDPLNLDAARRDKLTVLLRELGHAEV